MTQKDQYLTLSEAARLLGKSRMEIWRRASRGRLGAVVKLRGSKGYKILLSDLEKRYGAFSPQVLARIRSQEGATRA